MFCIQLLLNFAWAPTFFLGRMITVSLTIIIILWASILATIFLFYQESPLASYLLLPYLVWVSLATYLNAYIV